VRVCLAGCDATTTPACGEREAETGAVNATTLGAPLPLVAADVPICVVNRFGAPAVTGFAADVASGAVTGTINLSADLYRTSLPRVCPRCSTAAIGDIGVCDSGARQGRACAAAPVVQSPCRGGDAAPAPRGPAGLPPVRPPREPAPAHHPGHERRRHAHRPAPMRSDPGRGVRRH